MSVPRALLLRGINKMTNIHALSVAANSINGADDEDEEQKRDPHNCLRTRVAANVHTRQVNPLLDDAEWQRIERTGQRLRAESKDDPFYLEKEELLEKHTFEKEWHSGLYQFLDSAPKPACLVAYNGFNFDFPILINELRRCDGFFQKHFIPSGMVMADAYLAFLDIEKSYHTALECTVGCKMGNELLLSYSEIKAPINNSKNNSDNNSNNNSKVLSNVVGLLHLQETPRTVTPDIIIIEESKVAVTSTVETEMKRLRGAKRNLTSIYEIAAAGNKRDAKTNENKAHEANKPLIVRPNDAGDLSPMKRQSVFLRCSQSELRKMNDDSEDPKSAHPLNFISTSEWTPAIKRRIKNEYFIRSSGQWRFNSYNFKAGNFKLKNLYKQIIRNNFDAHRAQDDTEALTQLCMAYGKDFVLYVDAQQLQFPKGTVQTDTK